MEHLPGEEAQINFFRGPVTLDPESGRWHRPWIFRMVLSCCGHSYEEPLWRQEQVPFMPPGPEKGGANTPVFNQFVEEYNYDRPLRLRTCGNRGMYMKLQGKPTHLSPLQ
jgi:hypothetical protein